MIRIAAKIWRVLPYPIRLRIIRLSQPKFTVSVVAIVLNEKDEVLILDHFIRPGSTWGLPGGFIEPGECPDTAIKREILEETNLELEEAKLLRIRTVKRHIEMLFIGRADGEINLRTSEIRDFGWFSKDELPERISRVQRDLITETLSDKPI